MTKRQLIEEIMRLNRSARAEFLARFSLDELLDYLRQLKELSLERKTDDLLEVMAVA